MLVANSALGFPDGLRWQDAGERRVLPEAVPFFGVGAEDIANHIDRSIQDRRPLGVAPKQGGATRILTRPLAEICASHLQGLARLAQARCYQLRQFDANRVVDSVRHGLVLGGLAALCQREAGACGAGAAGSEIQPYLEGGIEEAALSGGRREDGLLGGAGSGDPAYRGRFFPVLVGFQGSGLGELRPRLTRGGTSCRSLLAEIDRLWGMISHAHFQARATLGARGKLGKISLFFVTESDGVSSVANWQVEVTIPCPVVDHPIARFGQLFVVQRHVHIDAPNVPLQAGWDQQIRDPSAHQHHVVTILAKDVHQLDEDGLGRVHGGGGIIDSFPCHVFSITWCFRNSAASSPRPLICRRSR